MKKMICEVCGSQSIKKEGGVFVCQECGIQYSLDEVRSLLKELDSNQTPAPVNEKQINITSENDKYKLLKNLLVWAKYLEILQAFEEFIFSTTDLSFWNKSIIEIMNIPTIFPDNAIQLKLNSSNLYDLCTPKEKEFAKAYVHKIKLTESDIPPIVERTYYSIRNDFTFQINDTMLGITFRKGELKLSAFPSLYSVTGDADYICEAANRKSLLEWSETLLNSIYEKSCKIYEKKTFGGEKLIYDFNAVAKPLRESLKNKENLYLEDYKNIILPAITERRKEFATVFASAKEIIALFDLPVAYRDFQAVINLMNLIIIGKAETWKEAVVLYDEENYRNEVLQKFDELNSTLKQMTTMITNKLDQIGFQITSELSSIEMNLTNLNLKLNESNKRLRGISLFTGLTMWNTI